MMVVGLGEILVVLLIRPLRFLLGGKRTPLGRGMLRFEEWLLHHLHVIGAESRMRHELGMHGQASSFLAEGLADHSKTMPSVSETVQRVREETGANLEASRRSATLQGLQGSQGRSELRRGQRRVDSSGGDRSEDIHEAMLEAQRRERQRAERERRNRARRH